MDAHAKYAVVYQVADGTASLGRLLRGLDQYKNE